MKQFDELAILLPCHSLEDLPTYYIGANADGLLSCWAALWQPAVLAACKRLPTWQRADTPPEPNPSRLFTVPAVSDGFLPTGWIARAQEQGAVVVRQQNQTRTQIAAQVLEAAEIGSTVADDLTADVVALGYAYLQQELLSRRMRYSSALDEGHFAKEVHAAARAVLAGDQEAARKHLTDAVEVLTEARDRFFPTEAWLIDLTLVAETTLGERMQQELQGKVPLNLLLTGATLRAAANQAPELVATIRQRWADQTLSVIGGHETEDRQPLLPVEDTLANLKLGHQTSEQLLGRAPTIYARRRNGLSPLLPQLLSRCEFAGAVHFTLDDGQFPSEEQSKTRWEGLDGSAIDALARVPVDANDPATFLAFSEKLGRAMDLDYVATLVFAHWPGQFSSWYDDLRRISAYGPVFGRFVTLEDYFATSQQPGRLSRFETDRYRTPYLKQDVAQGRGDPLSSIAKSHEADAARYAAAMLNTIATLCGASGAADEDPQSAARRLAESLAPGRTLDPTIQGASLLVCNPLSAARIVAVDEPAPGQAPCVVEVPAFGFVRVETGTERPNEPSAKRSRPRMVDEEELELRNEHLSAHVDRATGAIRAIRVPNKRRALMSQQLAFRQTGPPPRPGESWVAPEDRAIYSRMVADSVETALNTSDVGEIISRGRLVAGDVGVAQFTQHTRLLRGSKSLQLEIELEPLRLPEGDPWSEYFAARFAWSDELASFSRDVGLSTQSTENRRIEAPRFVAIHEDPHHTAILSGGLPYHVLVGERMLDTLLIVPGESRRRFRLGIAVAADYPHLAALELLTPPLVASLDRSVALGASGWFFHVDSRNVLATHWEPLVEAGRPVGFRARLIETAGRPGRCRLRAFRPVATAQQVNFVGSVLAELKVEAGMIQLDFTAGEWLEIVARFGDGSAA